MHRYLCCFASSNSRRSPPSVSVEAPRIPSSRLLVQPMPADTEGLELYEAQLWAKRVELDRKLKDVQNMIRSSIAQGQSIRAGKFLDMAKELKMQSDALQVRIVQVRSVPRGSLNTSSSSVLSGQTSVPSLVSNVYNPNARHASLGQV